MDRNDSPPKPSRSELLHVAVLLSAMLALFGGALWWHFGFARSSVFEWTAQSGSDAKPGADSKPAR